MNFKKIICMMISVILIFGSVQVATATDNLLTSQENVYEFPTKRLMMLGAISGDPDGGLRLYDTLTRAEFAKIIICTMQEKENALSNGGSSAFSDVPLNYWGNGYIQYAAKRSIITGYPDGSFAPEAPISFAQATTIVLRMLGYTDSDLGGHWPTNYMEKALALELSVQMNYSGADEITRGDAILMVDRALLTDIKKSSGATSVASAAASSTGKTTFIESLGYTIIEDSYIITVPENDTTLAEDEVRTTSGVLKTTAKDLGKLTGMLVKLILNKDKEIVLVYPKKNYTDAVLRSKLQSLGYTVIDKCIVFSTSESNEKLGEGQVKTSSGTYKTSVGTMNSLIGTMNTIVVDSHGYIVSVTPAKVMQVIGTVISVRSDEVEYVADDKTYVERISDNTIVFSDDLPLGFSTFLATITPGSKITLYGVDRGNWSHITIDTQEDIVPFVVRSVSENTINGITYKDPSAMKVYRDGLAASFLDIQKFDVVYYNEKINRLDIYITKIVGTYTDALPDKANVKSVIVGGKTYTIGSLEAEHMLDESLGSIKTNQRLTLLLGKNDLVIGVADEVSLDYMNYAVVLSTFSAISEKIETKGKSEYKVSLFGPDGNTYIYTADKDYKDLRGEMVRLSFAGDTVALHEINDITVSGELNKTERTLGMNRLASDVKIIERIDDYNTNDTDAKCALIELSDIQRRYITESDVYTVVYANAFKDIQILYLKNVTKSTYQYGILTSRDVAGSTMRSIYTYTLDLNGKESVFANMSVGYVIPEGSPVGVIISGGQIKDMYALRCMVEDSSIDAVEEERIMIDNQIYKMASDVIVYKQSGKYWEYVPIAISELRNLKISNIKLYGDKSTNMGSLIKVIKVIGQ